MTITRDTPYRDVGPVTLATWNNTVSRYGGRAALGTERAWRAGGMYSCHVFPVDALNDPPDCVARYTVFHGKSPVSKFAVTRNTCGSDFLHLIVVQLRSVVIRPVMTTMLRVQIPDVIRLGAQEKMLRITAPAIVAVVTDEHIVQDVADEQCVGKTMRLELPLLPVDVDSELAVSVRETRPLPFPASIFRWGRYPAIESLRHSCRNHGLSKLGPRHSLTSYIGLGVRRAGDVPPSPGFSLPQLYLGGSYAN